MVELNVGVEVNVL